MIRLYITTTEEAEKLSEDYCRKHFPLRLERAERYRFREDYLRCIAAGALLWEILGIQEEELITGPQGKPAMRLEAELRRKTSRRQFNLSHSGNYVILAVSDTPVGTDIEKMDEKHLTVAKRVFQPEEICWMEETAEERTERFFRLWTMKESVIKNLGCGFSMDPASFNALPLIHGEAITIDNALLFGSSLSVPGYAISVCCENRTEIITPKMISFKIC